MKIILEFIFSTCSEDIIFKKEINLNKTTSQLLVSMDMENISNDHFIITIKKIFKLRYANSNFFKRIDKICWFVGIDSPILIPYEMVMKLSNVKNNIDEENEHAILHSTLANLYAYHPSKYSSPPVGPLNSAQHNERQILIPKTIVTQLDKTINNMQKQLFNKEDTIPDPNV